MTELVPPFGAYALPGWAERVRRLGERAPSGRMGMHVASALRRFCLSGRAEPIDIEAWPGVRARVYPSDNRCEKRVFCAPHLWDFRELAALQAALAAAPAERDFVFFDLGANVGFYSLYLDAAARRTGRRARIVAAEPDPENRRRLQQNLTASDAAFVEVSDRAIGAAPGRARLAGGERNRGEVRVDGDAGQDAGPDAPGGVEVEVETVAGLARRVQAAHIDAMKLDLEGLDVAALEAFLTEAPETLRPELLIVETSETAGAPIAALAGAHGYGLEMTTRTNAIYRRADLGRAA